MMTVLYINGRNKCCIYFNESFLTEFMHNAVLTEGYCFSVGVSLQLFGLCVGSPVWLKRKHCLGGKLV